MFENQSNYSTWVAQHRLHNKDCTTRIVTAKVAKQGLQIELHQPTRENNNRVYSHIMQIEPKTGKTDPLV